VPPYDPGSFGRFGKLVQMEKHVRQMEDFQKATKAARKELVDTFGKAAVKSGESAKKAYAEVAAAMALVDEEVKSTTKNAKEYGKILARDSKVLLDFAKKHKLSLQEAADMYKKVKESQSKVIAGIGDWLKRWGSVAATIGAFTAEYRKRIDEVRTGHQLLLADQQLIGPGAKDTFQKTQKYIDGYREAIRSAHDMTAKYGASADEARGVTKALAFSLRGMIPDASKIGQTLKADTDLMYGFSRVMNVDVGTALEYFRNEMRVHGKTHEQARKSMDTTIAGFEQLRGKIGAAAAPLKEEYLATLQAIKSEMGPTQVSTQAMTGAMNLLAEAGRKAGLTAGGVKDAMGALPKMAKQMPQYYRIALGRMMMHNKKMLASLPEGLRKQVETIRKDPSLMPFQKAELVQEITAGSKAGIMGMMKFMQKQGPMMRGIVMKQMGLSAQQQVAFMKMFQDVKAGKISIGDAAAHIDKMRQDAKKTRQSMPQLLTANTQGLDKAALRTQQLEAQVKGLIDKYSTYIGPALGALTLALNAGSWLNAMKGLAGGLGGAAGALGKFGSVATKAGGVLASFGVGYALGTQLDKWLGLSDKISSTLFKAHEEELRKAYRAKTSGVQSQAIWRNTTTQIQRFQEMMNKGIKTVEVSHIVNGKLVKERKALTKDLIKEQVLRGMGLKDYLKAGHINQKQAQILRQLVDLKVGQLKTGPATETAKQKQSPMRAEAKADRGARALALALAKQKQAQIRAEAKADKGARALKVTTPTGRATVTQTQSPTSATAQGGPLAPQGTSQAPGAPPGTTPSAMPSQYDPTQGTLTLQSQTTLNINDPAQRQWFQTLISQNQSTNKRGR